MAIKHVLRELNLLKECGCSAISSITHILFRFELLLFLLFPLSPLFEEVPIDRSYSLDQSDQKTLI